MNTAFPVATSQVSHCTFHYIEVGIMLVAWTNVLYLRSVIAQELNLALTTEFKYFRRWLSKLYCLRLFGLFFSSSYHFLKNRRSIWEYWFLLPGYILLCPKLINQFSDFRKSSILGRKVKKEHSTYLHFISLAMSTILLILGFICY